MPDTPKEEGRGAGARSLNETMPESSRAVARSARDELAPGASFGRYVVLELIGAGAMGAVFAAYDSELDRKVALKLLRPDVSPIGITEDLRARLLREARTMAQLSHPNVVAVHDVGTLGDSVFIAMDFVHGTTLREWLAAAPRSWREIVNAFLDAARGLAAAHEIGIIHRDFKPENILIDRKGRVFVADFGLARGTREVDAGVPGSPPPTRAIVTSPGGVIGTPAYMAPEQHEGKATERSDIFGFGVALYEALYGAHPFPTTNLAKLREAAQQRKLQEPPSGARVPRFVRDAVLRAMEPDPESRWPRMEALIEALLADPAPRRRRLAIGAGVLLLGVVAALVSWLTREAQGARCRGGPTRIAGSWDDTRRAELNAAFAATRLPYAYEAVQLTTRALDLFAGTWIRSYQDACEATHVRGEQSLELFDRRMRCLDDRLRDLAGLVTTLTRADAKTVENASQAASRLRPISVCEDWRALSVRVAPPKDAATQAAVDTARAELAKIRALEMAGHYRSARTLAEGAVSKAKHVGYPPLLAEALYRLGRADDALGAYAPAVTSLRDAAATAVAARHEDIAVRAHIGLARTLGRAGQRESALVVSDLALAHVAGAGGNRVLRAEALRARADVLRYALSSEKGTEAALREAVALLGEAPGEEARFAAALMELSGSSVNLGRYAEAIPLAERAAMLAERVFGTLHPQTAVFWAQIGAVLIFDHQYGKALAILGRALERQESALGPTHLYVISTRSNLARALIMLGRYRDAKDVLARIPGAEGPEWTHTTAFRLALWLARADLKLGNVAAAWKLTERLVGWAPKRFGAKNDLHGEALRLRAEALEQRGDDAAALRDLRAAIAIFSALDDWIELSPSLRSEVRLLRRLGRTQEAIAHGERAQATLEARLGFGVDAALLAIEVGKARLAAGEARAARAGVERAAALLQERSADLSPELRANARSTLARVQQRN